MGPGLQRRQQALVQPAETAVAHQQRMIATTLEGLRRRVGGQRIVAVLEPRSNTMRAGVHHDTLAESLRGADSVWIYAPADLGWDARAVMAPLGDRAHTAATPEALLSGLLAELRAGDHALLMSNGGFGGLHECLLAALQARAH
jgi:UDP-N-acetylmuramate: L-alanyl-gamma-D-glutamyl-meso-diaminopimelate ligase